MPGKKKIRMGLILVYISIQCFLPWSHFITKGYNGWTEGTYGYSWDMMIHSFSTQHVKIKYVDTHPGAIDTEGYLKSDSFTTGRATSRWTQHPEQLWQYAHCIEEKLKDMHIGTTDHRIQLYFDVWKSMNSRFHQRVYDPNMNILESEWKWNKRPTYVKPLLTNYNDWRKRIKTMRKELMTADNYTEVTFIADFPGLHLENYLNEDFTNTTIKVLDGNVEIELVDQEDAKNIPLNVGESHKLPAGEFHNIHTVGENPSCYVYIFVNTTYKEESEEFDRLRVEVFDKIKLDERDSFVPTEAQKHYYDMFLKLAKESQNEYEKARTFKKDKMLRFIEKKLGLVYRSYLLSKYAMVDLFFGMKVEWADYVELNRPYFFPSKWFSNKYLVENRDKRMVEFQKSKQRPPKPENVPTMMQDGSTEYIN